MSIRVARVHGAESRASSEIAGERWALTLEDEEGLAPAPELPRGKARAPVACRRLDLRLDR